jgi:hypothetical protein
VSRSAPSAVVLAILPAEADAADHFWTSFAPS